MIITKEFIEKGKSKNGGWSKKQLALLKVAWPPEKGWQLKIIGNTIADDLAKKFLNDDDEQFNLF